MAQPSSRKVVKLECTAHTNTWANQRRKRRQRQRHKLKTQDNTGSDIVPQDAVPDKESARVVGSGSDVQCKLMDLECGQGIENRNESKGQSDGGCPMQSAVANECLGQTAVADKATNVDADSTLHSGTTNIAVATGTNNLNSSSKCHPDISSESNPGSSVRTVNSNSSGNDGGAIHQSSSTQEWSSSMPRSVISDSQLKPTGNQEKAVTETCESMQDIESNLKSMSEKLDQDTQNASAPRENRHEMQVTSVLGSDTKPQVDISEGAQTSSFEAKDKEPLFKCSLVVKFVDDKIVVEMSFLDGSSREAMHQVGQYIKNQFAK